jgi:epsilon-lactone hydrolase
MPSIESRILAASSRLLIKRVMDAPTFDVVALRRAMNSRRLLPAFLPRGVRIEPSREPKLPGEWHLPTDAAPRRTILHLHGGGYVAGTPKAFRSFAAWLAVRARARVLVLDYRLAPEHPFPAGLDDAVGAIRALQALGTDARSLGIVGDSAGGGLTLAALLALRDAGDPLPAAAALISPFVDLAFTGESVRTNAARDSMLSARHKVAFARAYAPSHAAEHPLVSPLYADLKGLPSLLIHASDSEILFDDARRVAEKARAAGVAVEFTVFRELLHDWHASVPLTPESRHAVKGVGAYFARRIG